MKKFLLFLAVVAAGVWAADYFGYYKLPWTSDQVAQQTQRFFGRGGRRNPQKLEEVPVLVAAVRREDVPVTIEGVGTVQALNTVVVRAQVEGRLTEILFRDGQDVKKGDVLARIDPRTYQALYDQAVAKKAQDEATLANARIDLERYQRLAASNFGSRQQADTQAALVKQLEAQVRNDQAVIDNAKVNLDYTTIVATLDGRTGIRAIDAGNIVRGSDANGIVTITQVKPIAAIFSLPQQQLRALSAGIARGRLDVQALDADNVTVIDTGSVDVVDNQVDPATGTVKVKASFPNAAQSLWPGQFINIKLTVDVIRDAVVTPTAAVQRGPKGAFVYVVTDENKAVMTPVTVSRQDEQKAMIASGVGPGQRVVTTGFSQLTDGAAVKPSPADQPAGEPVAAGSPGARPEGQQQRRQGDGAQPGARRQGEAGGAAGRPQGEGQGQPGARGQRGPGQANAAPTAQPAAPVANQ